MNPGSHFTIPTTRALAVLLLICPLLVASRLGAQPVAATVDPAFTNAALESSVTFCVQVSGAGPFAYQWQKNGLILPGQTNACLVLSNITIADGGSYRATVSADSVALASEEGVLLVGVNSLPANDQFSYGTAITAPSNSVRGASFGASREAYEPFHFGLSTSNSVWYRWRAPTNGIVTFDTRGSAFDTVMAVYGGSLGRLTEIASDDDGGGFHTSQVSWNAQAGVDYHVVIDGVTGETGDYVCNWYLETTSARLPIITLKPRSETVLEGETATFIAAATDPRGTPDFQWFHNGELIPGATSSNLALVNVQTVNLGHYQLAVTNSVGRVAISAPVDLEIGPDPGIQSKDKIAEVPTKGGGGGTLMASSVSAGTFSLSAGTVINQRFFNGGTSDRCEPAHCGVPGGASRWFQLVAASDGICTLDTEGSDADTILAVYLQNFAICTNLYEPLVDCNNDVLGTCEQILAKDGPRKRTSRLSFFAPAGTTYRAVVDTVGGVRGTNVHFNVHFASTSSVPARAVQLGVATNCLLQLRGSSVTLQVADSLVSPSNSYQWLLNGRRIAGAARDRLILPNLNFSDAGRYSVSVQNGASRSLLPGAAVVVMEPCQPEGTPLPGTPFRLLGATAEPIELQSIRTLNTTASWQTIGTIRPSIDPSLWDSGTNNSQFYRALRPPP